jgi:hypothetical protein
MVMVSYTTWMRVQTSAKRKEATLIRTLEKFFNLLGRMRISGAHSSRLSPASFRPSI